MPDRRIALLVFLTFAGMVGIYVGAWMAYKKYQEYSASLQSSANSVNNVLTLIKGV